LWCQPVSYLGRFDGSEVNDQVFLQWQMLAGNVCQGIDIYRSADSLQFDLIGHISGDCGNISEPVDFNFTDPAPLPNQKNYYRLELGLLGLSHIIPVFVNDPGENNMLLYPNPAGDQVKILFRNDGNLPAQLGVFNAQGMQVFATDLRGDAYVLHTHNLPAGNYLAVVTIDGNIIREERLQIIRE
jgi:hypothetical protein